MDLHNQVSPATTEVPQGRTVITETAVAKVVGVAVRGVAGVHTVGAGTSRSLGAIREAVGATDLTQGVGVEVGDSQVAVDIVLVAEYGFPLQTLAHSVRAAVYAAVEELVGRGVIEVNIEIVDVFIPGPEQDKVSTRPRISGRLTQQTKPVAVGKATVVAEEPLLPPEEGSATRVDYNNLREVGEPQ